MSIAARANAAIHLPQSSRFLLVGTASNGTAKPVDVQNGELGADAVVLSTEINDNVDFDLKDVFLNTTGNTQGRWIDTDSDKSKRV